MIDSPVRSPERRAVAPLLVALLSASTAGASSQRLAGEEGPLEPLVAPPPGTQAVELVLAESVDPEGFLREHGLADRMLSERPGARLMVAVDERELRRLEDLLRTPDLRSLDVLPEDATAGPTEYTYARMVSELTALAAAHPAIARLTAYPNATHEGRTIYEIKLSDNVDDEEDEPTAFFVGVHHGGEMIGCDILMFWLTDTLASYGVDPVKTAWVDDHEVRVIVIGNPDGWMGNETGVTSGWRKNWRDNNGSGTFETNADGVDLNRNFDWGWSLNGSGSPGSSIYRGPNPASEPEVQVCQGLLLANRPSLAVSFHQSGEIVYLPWTWNGNHTPDHPTYFAFAQAIGDAIPKQSGVGTYPPVVESRVGGFIDDWIYSVTGGLCVTPEVSWSAAVTTIAQVVQNNQGVFPVVFQRLAGSQVTGHVTDAISGAPLAAKIELLEIDTSALPDRSSDLAFGRYRWLTQPGSYTLRVSRAGYHSQTVPGVVVGAGGPTEVDVALVPHFSARGTGLAGGGGLVPRLTGGGTPVIGSPVSMQLDQGLGGAPAVFALGKSPTSQPLFGGTLLVAPPFLARSTVLSGMPGVPGAGSASLAGTLPNDPGLVGRTFHAQALVLDPDAVQGRALSAALETHVR